MLLGSYGSPEMTPREIFLAALGRRRTPRAATGSATSVVTTDLMEHVGVFFPEANLDPEAMASLAQAGNAVLGLDNVMPLFGVWHESEALGCEVDWGAPSRMPDCRKPLLRVGQSIRLPPDLLTRRGCRVPLEAIRLLRKRLGAEVAVVGKVFGPWTLGYHLFGVQEFLMNTLLQPQEIRKALRRLMEVTVAFGRAQVEAGADALCLGDHATRDLCSPLAYRDFLAEIHGELMQRLGCPVILHICGDTRDRIPYIRETGVACFHFDSKVSAPEARRLAGARMSLMGGTSNLSVVRAGTPEDIRRDVAEKHAAGVDILGPECAVPLDAPWRNLAALAREAKSLPVS